MMTRQVRLIVTFASNEDALTFEASAKEASVPGRLIPVPRDISTGCGLAFCAKPEYNDVLTHLIEEQHLRIEGIHRLKLNVLE